jgi:hypothetical protein
MNELDYSSDLQPDGGNGGRLTQGKTGMLLTLALGSGLGFFGGMMLGKRKGAAEGLMVGMELGRTEALATMASPRPWTRLWRRNAA